MILDETGYTVEELFDSFDEHPIGAGKYPITTPKFP